MSLIINDRANKQQQEQSLEAYISSPVFQQQLQRALPLGMRADRTARVILTAFRLNPSLLECSRASVLGAVIQAAQLGIEPDSGLGHAYLVPYKGKCSLIIGYRGMLDLARRSGQIKMIQAHVVGENDVFDYEYGLNPFLRHKPNKENPGKPAYFYAVAELVNGGIQFDVMTNEEVQSIMRGTPSSQGSSSPWQKFYSEMGRKTVLRRLFKWLPVSIEATKAAILDEKADLGIQDNTDALYEFDPSLVPEVTKPTIDENGELLEKIK